MLSVNLLMISRSRRISSSVGYCSFCGYWPCWNGEYEKPEICSGQLGAATGRLISAQKPVNKAAMASTTTRLSPNLRDDIAISGSKGCGTKERLAAGCQGAGRASYTGGSLTVQRTGKRPTLGTAVSHKFLHLS